MGALSDGADEKEKGPPPPSYYMGRAMGSGSGLGRSGFAPPQQGDGDDIFLSYNSQQHQFGGLQK